MQQSVKISYANLT